VGGRRGYGKRGKDPGVPVNADLKRFGNLRRRGAFWEGYWGAGRAFGKCPRDGRSTRKFNWGCGTEGALDRRVAMDAQKGVKTPIAFGIPRMKWKIDLSCVGRMKKEQGVYKKESP